MATRITNTQSMLAFIDQIFRTRADLENVREEVGSGLRVSQPSDDPSRAGTISQFQSGIKRLERHQQRISSTVGFMETQESVLTAAESVMLRGKELATQAANGVISSEARQAMAAEVFELRNTLVGLANTRYQGVYLFGGAEDDTEPFTSDTYTEPAATVNPDANARYVYNTAAGAQETRTVRISDNETIRVNTPGDQMFQSAISSLERLGRALAGYETDPAPPALPDGSGAAYTFPGDYAQQSADIQALIDEIETARNDEIVTERTSVGSRLNRLKQSAEIVEVVKLNTQTGLSAIQDADIFEAASRFSDLQLALEGLLASGSRANSLTLLDFL